MRKRRVKLLNNKYIICTMWNKIKLAAQIRRREREKKNGAPKSHVLMSVSLVAKPKSGPDYSVSIMK
jgi:hypothetical protein